MASFFIKYQHDVDLNNYLMKKIAFCYLYIYMTALECQYQRLLNAIMLN